MRQDRLELRRMLSIRFQRKLRKNLELSFEGKLYQIHTKTTGYRLRHKEVMICEHLDDSVEILCDGKPLEYKVLTKVQRIKQADCKEINALVDEVVEASNLNDLNGGLPFSTNAPLKSLAQLSL